MPIFYQKNRHRSLARLYCPHIRIAPEQNGISHQSLFLSPPGTLDWIRTQCGTMARVSPSDDETKEMAKYYLENPKKYNKKMRKFEKHAKKSFSHSLAMPPASTAAL